MKHSQILRRSYWERGSADATGPGRVPRAGTKRNGRRSSRAGVEGGCSAETRSQGRVRRRNRRRRSATGAGPSDERERRQGVASEAVNLELRRAWKANEILRQGVGVFRPGGARPPTQELTSRHRRAPRPVRGRADLQGAADRPVDVLRERRPGLRTAAPVPGVPIADTASRHIRACVGGELPGRGSQGAWRQLQREASDAVARCTVAD